MICDGICWDTAVVQHTYDQQWCVQILSELIIYAFEPDIVYALCVLVANNMIDVLSLSVRRDLV